jgi:hypothetical protein
MCSAPSADFDCSGLYLARRLLNVVAQAAAQESGCLRTRTHAFLQVSCYLILTPYSAAVSVKSINMSHNLLTSTIAAELQQHLQRFPALQHVNMSDNPFLGTSGVTAIISSLAGA